MRLRDRHIWLSREPGGFAAHRRDLRASRRPPRPHPLQPISSCVNTCSVTRQRIRARARRSAASRATIPPHASSSPAATRRAQPAARRPSAERARIVAECGEGSRLVDEVCETRRPERFGPGDGPCGAPIGAGRPAAGLRSLSGSRPGVRDAVAAVLHHSDDEGRGPEHASRGRCSTKGRTHCWRRVRGNRAHGRSPGIVRTGPDAARVALQSSSMRWTGAIADVVFRVSLAGADGLHARRRVADCREAAAALRRTSHLPLQHASDRVLALMRRSYIARLLSPSGPTGSSPAFPHAAIGTDLIVGFPGRDR